MKLDYSEIQETANATLQESDWEPPRHVFFGKKDGRGKMEKEPNYAYVEYPRMMYALQDGAIKVRQVNNDEDVQRLGEGWEKTPAAFGYIGAPSFDQHIEALKPAEEEVRKAGRPPKAKE